MKLARRLIEGDDGLPAEEVGIARVIARALAARVAEGFWVRFAPDSPGGGSEIRTLGPPSTVSSLHPGARDTTHGAIVKVRNADPVASTELAERFVGPLAEHRTSGGAEPRRRAQGRAFRLDLRPR